MKNKGSLTVEACLSMVFFLTTMLLFLFFIKIVMIEYSIQNIASESAKRISSSTYAFQIIQNQFNYCESIDDMEKDNRYGKQISKMVISDLGGGIFNMFTESLFEANDAKRLTSIEKGSFKLGINMIKSAGKMVLTSEMAEAKFFEIKQNMQDKIFQEVSMSIASSNKFLDKDKIIVEHIKYPEAATVFSKRLSNEIYDKIGVDGKTYLEREDVVVVLSYPFEMNFPFFGKQKFVITKTAVEHAWVYGGNGIVAKQEGLISKLASEATNIVLYGFTTVEITNNGQFYHRSSCSNLIGEYSTPMRKYNAMKQGFKACATCAP